MALKKISASDIRKAMSKRWAAPEWALMWEVNQGTGAQSGRSADAVMMSLWPSRGLELHGVEIKISRSDWRREAADPTKAEAIAKYCDRWWVHTAPGVVDDLSDVPPAWGLREWDGKRWTTLREAEKTAVAAIDRPFLAALLRRGDGAIRSLIQDAMQESELALQAERQKMREDFATRLKNEVERRTAQVSKAADTVAKFEEAFGAGVATGCGVWQAGEWGRAAKALAELQYGGNMELITSRLRTAADELEALLQLAKSDKP